MKRIILLICLTFIAGGLLAQESGLPEIKVGLYSTTHVLFQSDLTYVDLAMPDLIAARVVESSKNMLALKARKRFDVTTTISALEANGTMHTFKVAFEEFPMQLLVDTRSGSVLPTPGQLNTQVRTDSTAVVATQSDRGGGTGVDITSSETSNFARKDAPTLEEVTRTARRLYHIGDRNFGIEAYCVNIYVYSDLTYLVLNVKNRTDIGYEAGDAQFTIENLSPKRNALATDKTVWIKSSFGSLSCAPRGETVVGYTIPKLTLMKGECLKIYIYEKSGKRNLLLTIPYKELNYAVSPKKSVKR